MKKTVAGIGLLFVCILLAGGWMWFRHNRNVHAGLSEAESLMAEHPDSALIILQKVRYPEYFGDNNKALYALLLTQAQYKNYLPVMSDSLIRIALEYYSAGKDSVRKSWACFYMGQVCRDLQEQTKAVGYFQRAAIAAEKSGSYKLQDLIYYHWGKLLQTKKPYEEGFRLLQESEKYARLNKDTASVITTLGEIGWSYVWMKNYERANLFFREGIKMAHAIGDDESLAIFFHKTAVSCYQDKQYVKALDNINRSLSYTWKPDAICKPFSMKGRILLELQEYDSARYYIEKGKRTADYYEIASYQDVMSKLEERLGNYRKALEHRTVYADYLDSIDNNEEDKNVMELQKKYDYSVIKSENDRLKIESQSRKITILVIVLSAAFLVFIFYYRSNRIKRRNEHIIYTKDMLLAKSMSQLQQKSNELLRHKQILQEKENELRQHLLKVQGLSEDIFHREEELFLLEKQQQELKEKIFKTDEVVRKIELVKLMNDGNKARAKTSLVLSGQELENLLSVINSCYDDFAVRLQQEFSALTQDDIYVCCLLRMEVSNGDIMVLLDTNEVALKKRKYRIKREKIGIAQANLSLDEFLLSY